MSGSVFSEATSSSISDEDDLYTFKEEPCSPVAGYSSDPSSYSADSATSGTVTKAATPCKGFFRRSIQKQIEYRCLRDGKCLVIRLNRNRCQFCRFKKCLAVGMSKDSVRYGRVPKRPREPSAADSLPEPSKRPVHTSATTIPPTDPLEAQLLRQEMSRELVKLITAAHRGTNTYSEEIRASLEQHPISIRVEESEGEGSGAEDAASSTTDRATDARSVLWHNIAVRMTPAVQQVVEFAKRLPGFHGLPQDDQLIVIKLGFFEVWLTRITGLSTPDRIMFEDGTIFTHAQLATIYDATFATAMLTYIWNIQRLCMTEEEMAVYTGTLLLCPQRAGLSAADRIQGLQNAMNDALQNIQAATHGGPEAVALSQARYEAFAAARNEVRQLGFRHNVLLAWPREHWQRLLLPPLFSEIFDIPKRDEDANGDSAATSPGPVPRSPQSPHSSHPPVPQLG